MNKFNSVIKNYINEQMLSVNPTGLPKKFTGLNTNTENLSELLMGLSAGLSNSSLEPNDSIELQKFLNPDDTSHSDAISFLEKPENKKIKDLFIDKKLYIPQDKTKIEDDKQNPQSTPTNNTTSSSSPAVKAPEGSAYSAAPKA